MRDSGLGGRAAWQVQQGHLARAAPGHDRAREHSNPLRLTPARRALVRRGRATRLERGGSVSYKALTTRPNDCRELLLRGGVLASGARTTPSCDLSGELLEHAPTYELHSPSWRRGSAHSPSEARQARARARRLLAPAATATRDMERASGIEDFVVASLRSCAACARSALSAWPRRRASRRVARGARRRVVHGCVGSGGAAAGAAAARRERCCSAPAPAPPALQTGGAARR
jgi:hypothetical protein